MTTQPPAAQQLAFGKQLQMFTSSRSETRQPCTKPACFVKLSGLTDCCCLQARSGSLYGNRHGINTQVCVDIMVHQMECSSYSGQDTVSVQSCMVKLSLLVRQHMNVGAMAPDAWCAEGCMLRAWRRESATCCLSWNSWCSSLVCGCTGLI